MEFQKSVIELIKTRTSSRSYDEREINTSDLKKLTAYFAEINDDKSIMARFVLAHSIGTPGGTAKKLSTYGFITGAGKNSKISECRPTGNILYPGLQDLK